MSSKYQIRTQSSEVVESYVQNDFENKIGVSRLGLLSAKLQNDGLDTQCLTMMIQRIILHLKIISSAGILLLLSFFTEVVDYHILNKYIIHLWEKLKFERKTMKTWEFSNYTNSIN